jgi:hypothetical protein
MMLIGAIAIDTIKRLSTMDGISGVVVVVLLLPLLLL